MKTAICLKALNKAPEERFKSMDEFAAALGSYIETTSRSSPSSDSGDSVVEPDARQELSSSDLATDLLEKLAARIQSSVPPASRSDSPLGSLGWVWAAIAVAAISLAGWALYSTIDRPDRLQHVSVQQLLIDLDISQIVSEPNVIIFLDGNAVTNPQLSDYVDPGNHELVVKRGDEIVMTHPFTVQPGSAETGIAARTDPAPSRSLNNASHAEVPDVSMARDEKPPTPTSEPPVAAVDPSLAVWVSRYYGTTANHLHSKLWINDDIVADFKSDAQQNISKHLRPGWNTLVLETSPSAPVTDSNNLSFVVGRVHKMPDGENEMDPFWRQWNGPNWKIKDGRYTHQLGPGVSTVRLSCELYYAGFDFEDREIEEGDFVLEGKPYYSSTNTSVTATVSVNGRALTTYGAQQRRVIITDLLQKGNNTITLVSSRVDNCLEDNDILFSVSGPAEYNANKGAFSRRPVASFTAMTGWQRNKQTGQLACTLDPDSSRVERAIPLYLRGEPRNTARSPKKPEMMVWVNRYYGGDTENPLHGELRINDRMISHFTSTTQETITAALKKGDWNEVSLRTLAQEPAGGWNELQFSLGLVERNPQGSLMMAPKLWFFKNGDGWKHDNGRLTHRLNPKGNDLTLKFHLFHTDLQYENREAENGDFILEGVPYYNESVTSVTSTVYVNDTPLNTFASLRRQVLITPLLKPGKNRIRLVTKRVENGLEDNDITMFIRGPGEYHVGQGKYVFPEVMKFDSLSGWQRDQRSGQLMSIEESGSDTVERSFEFQVAELPE